MFLKKSFVSVSAIRQQESIMSDQNQLQISRFPEQFAVSCTQFKQNLQHYQCQRRPLHIHNKQLKQNKFSKQKRSIKTQSCTEDQNINSYKVFFSGQSFRNSQPNNKVHNYDSLKRQYEMKFQKQTEFYELKQWKYKQEIQSLNSQIQNLRQKLNKKQRHLSESTIVSPTPLQSRIVQINKISDESNQQYHIHLKSMLKRISLEHQECIQTKKRLLKQIQTSNMKLSALDNQVALLGKQLKQNKQIIKQMKDQNDCLERQVASEKDKLKNNQKIKNSTIQQLQMRIDKYKYQSQAKQRQAKHINNQTRSTQSQQLKAAKILNNSFYSTEKEQINYKIFIQRPELPKYSTDRQIISQMYHKNINHLNVKADLQEKSLGSIRHRYIQALPNDQKNAKTINLNASLKKYKGSEHEKDKNINKRQTSLKFKYL